MHSIIIVPTAPKCLQACAIRWQKVPRVQFEFNKKCLFTVLGPIKPSNWKVTREVHIPKLGISPAWRTIQRGFKVAATQLTSHCQWSTPLTCIQSGIQLMQINPALFQLCHIIPARKMGLVFCLFFYIPSNSDFKLATTSHNLLFLDIHLWNSHSLYIYPPPLQLKYVILLFRMSYERKYN